MAYTYWDADAARHLIRVASGLDSQVLGEPQILGQVKTAYDIARSAGTLGPELNLLSQVTLSTAKRVRTDTDIGRNPVSVAYAAVVMAQQIFTDLKTKRALLLGAGDTIPGWPSTCTERHRRHGGGQPHAGQRRGLAGRFGARAMQLTDVAGCLHEYDIVIASTGSALPVVGKGAVEHAIRPGAGGRCSSSTSPCPGTWSRRWQSWPTSTSTPSTTSPTSSKKTCASGGPRRSRRKTLVDDGASHYVRERRPRQSQGLLRLSATRRRRSRGRAGARAARAGEPAATRSGAGRSGARLTNKLIHRPRSPFAKPVRTAAAICLEYLKSLYRLD
jgi:glutamyl-tRNA reductase